MADLTAQYRIILSEAYRTRVEKNPRYTRTAFARSIGLDRTYFSKLSSGKILLSLDIADRVAKALKLCPESRKDFLLSAAEEQRCHALYLLDPTLTDCDLDKNQINRQPVPRNNFKR